MNLQPKTICWDCANACGRCDWSADLTPVEGWEAIPTRVRIKEDNCVDSFFVVSCPEFVRDAREGGLYRVRKGD